MVLAEKSSQYHLCAGLFADLRGVAKHSESV